MRRDQVRVREPPQPPPPTRSLRNYNVTGAPGTVEISTTGDARYASREG